VEQQNLPDSLQGKHYYTPSDQGFEKQVAARLKAWRQEMEKTDKNKKEGEG
jgi:replication-associated recombination protein RarA